jgi:hypothetical protein
MMITSLLRILRILIEEAIRLRTFFNLGMRMIRLFGLVLNRVFSPRKILGAAFFFAAVCLVLLCFADFLFFAMTDS